MLPRHSSSRSKIVAVKLWLKFYWKPVRVVCDAVSQVAEAIRVLLARVVGEMIQVHLGVSPLLMERPS